MLGQAFRWPDRRRLASRRWVHAVAFVGVVGVVATAVQAQDIILASSRGTLVIQSDRGGYLAKRRVKVAELRASGTRVELRGTCISACTMYLSLPNVCVSPTAVFGFHGPSRSGQPLSPEKFDYWSEVMARGYREPLHSWYMQTARYTIVGYYTIKGQRLIEMGYPPC